MDNFLKSIIVFLKIFPLLIVNILLMTLFIFYMPLELPIALLLSLIVFSIEGNPTLLGYLGYLYFALFMDFMTAFGIYNGNMKDLFHIYLLFHIGIFIVIPYLYNKKLEWTRENKDSFLFSLGNDKLYDFWYSWEFMGVLLSYISIFFIVYVISQLNNCYNIRGQMATMICDEILKFKSFFL